MLLRPVSMARLEVMPVLLIQRIQLQREVFLIQHTDFCMWDCIFGSHLKHGNPDNFTLDVIFTESWNMVNWDNKVIRKGKLYYFLMLHKKPWHCLGIVLPDACGSGELAVHPDFMSLLLMKLTLILKSECAGPKAQEDMSGLARQQTR